jgi:hypothetical protein
MFGFFCFIYFNGFGKPSSDFTVYKKSNLIYMNNFFRAIIAGYGAKKLGGGCLGTIIVFILIWVALGYC